jgi:hypothetical protein
LSGRLIEVRIRALDSVEELSGALRLSGGSEGRVTGRNKKRGNQYESL